MPAKPATPKAAKSKAIQAKAVLPKTVVQSETLSDRSSPSTPDPPVSEASRLLLDITREDGIIKVDPKGDVILKVTHGKASHSFRLSSTTLKTKSKYFERLFQPGRFEEARKVETAHKELREKYLDPSDAPVPELPVIEAEDLGRISNVKATDALLTDFFLALYARDLQTVPPVGNLANLAVVADRFDAIDTVRSFVARKKFIRNIEGRTTPKAEAALSEEKLRQRLLVGLLLDYPSWVTKYSAQLIIKGWVGQEADVSAPLWWDLPSRVEEELAFRRACILETIQSLQSHFLSLYTSRERQCKLGYDSSAQCDSFQLGEMVRFFSKMGLLRFQGALIDDAEPPAQYEGDLLNLLDSLRQVPEYQIDRFHSHCGIRTRLTPLLDLLQQCLQPEVIGICFDCWSTVRAEYAWIEAKAPLLWKRINFRGVRAQTCAVQHRGVREMFTSNEREWVG